MAIQTKVKRWGNSWAVRLPNELIMQEELAVGDDVLVQVVRVADLSDIFGQAKKKIRAQRAKDEARKAWA